jgi:hypothetical protein
MDAHLVKDGARPVADGKGFLAGPDRPHALPPWEGPPARDRYRDPLSNT